MPYKDPSVRKSKHKEYSRDYYLKHRQDIIEKTAGKKKQFREEWHTFKSTLKCTKCGFSHIAALDFHHTDPTQKDGNIHRFVSNGQFTKVYEEIKKCVVLCANCHRTHHYAEKKSASF